MNTPLPRGHEIHIFGRGLPDLHNYAYSAEVKKKIVAGTLFNISQFRTHLEDLLSPRVL